MILLTVAATGVLLFLCRPYQLFGGRGGSIRIFRTFDKNWSMQLHVYKNAFLALGQQLNLARLYLMNADTEGSMEYIENGINLTGNFLKDIENRLAMLKVSGIHWEETDLVVCMERAVKRVVPPNVTLVRSYQRDSIVIYGHAYHMEESFVNLLQNALEAMRKAECAPVIQIHMLCEDDYCMIEIRDNGVGIDRKNFRHIFDPFFSTKGGINGGGIGLYYVRRVMMLHGGGVKVQSRQGEYTCMQVSVNMKTSRRK